MSLAAAQARVIAIDLPERLVQGRQGEYFGYFYDLLAADPAKITTAARQATVAAYRADRALTPGVD